MNKIEISINNNKALLSSRRDYIVVNTNVQ